MSKKIYSVEGLFGTINHYDEHGNYIGYSQEGIFGGMNHYDSNGKNVGYSLEGILGGENHYDNHGRQVGYSIDGILGGENHYNAKNGILILEKYIPFDSCLDSSMGIKAVIYPSNRSGYDCRIVSIEVGRKEMVGTFHKIRVGAGGCTFLHKDGFLASFDTLEQAIEAAKRVF